MDKASLVSFGKFLSLIQAWGYTLVMPLIVGVLVFIGVASKNSNIEHDDEKILGVGLGIFGALFLLGLAYVWAMKYFAYKYDNVAIFVLVTWVFVLISSLFSKASRIGK